MGITTSQLFVYTLVVLFGLSSWVSVNSVFVELPLLVESLPEGWGLPSFLSVIVQLASIGPLIVGLVEKCRCRHYNPVTIIYGLLGLGCVSTILLAFLWDRTLVFAGREYSGAIFILFFLLSLVDCTSNVLFLPYMSRFRPNLLTVYFVGMGFSALVPSCLALVQGAGHIQCRLVNVTINETIFTNGTAVVQELLPPRFNVTIFNLLIVLFMCAALVAFVCLNTLKVAKDQLSHPPQLDETKADGNHLTEDKSLLNHTTEERSVEVESPLSAVAYGTLLFITGWVCALMNGALPSLTSYACKPYGQLTYHLTATLSNLANPVACFIPFFIQLSSIPIVSVLSVVVTGLSAFIFSQAVASPNPILVGTDGGSVLMVLVWILAVGLLAYIRTVTAGILRGSQRPKALFWCGAATQLGSFLGAVVFFLLINYTGWFHSASSC